MELMTWVRILFCCSQRSVRMARCPFEQMWLNSQIVGREEWKSRDTILCTQVLSSQLSLIIRGPPVHLFTCIVWVWCCGTCCNTVCLRERIGPKTICCKSIQSTYWWQQSTMTTTVGGSLSQAEMFSDYSCTVVQLVVDTNNKVSIICDK